jgi:hypothetical protein
MSINGSFDQISEVDLLSLIDTGFPEGIAIDYKRAPYGRGDSDVKEFLKDTSSFANTIAGHLIIGVDESEAVPTRIIPITDLDPG